MGAFLCQTLKTVRSILSAPANIVPIPPFEISHLDENLVLLYFLESRLAVYNLSFESIAMCAHLGLPALASKVDISVALRANLLQNVDQLPAARACVFSWYIRFEQHGRLLKEKAPRCWCPGCTHCRDGLFADAKIRQDGEPDKVAVYKKVLETWKLSRLIASHGGLSGPVLHASTGPAEGAGTNKKGYTCNECTRTLKLDRHAVSNAKRSAKARAKIRVRETHDEETRQTALAAKAAEQEVLLSLQDRVKGLEARVADLHAELLTTLRLRAEQDAELEAKEEKLNSNTQQQRASENQLKRASPETHIPTEWCCYKCLCEAEHLPISPAASIVRGSVCVKS